MGEPTLDVEQQLLRLWHTRKEKGQAASVVDELSAMIRRAGILDEVEFYLPQLAHLIITLVEELPEMAVLERFMLAVCQLSVHLALQYFWLVYAALEENNPKRATRSQSVYCRCSLLLLHLEQCVVYGHGVQDRRSQDLQNLMQRCVQVATQSVGEDDQSTSGNVIFDGWLWKKGGGHSKLGRRTWSRRFLQVRQRTLFYYSNSDAGALQARGALSLSAAQVFVPPHPKYDFYFKVVCQQSGLVFHLRAETAEERSQWLRVLDAVLVLPQPPGLTSSDVKLAVTSLSKASTSTRTRSSCSIDYETTRAVICNTYAQLTVRNNGAEPNSLPGSPTAPISAESVAIEIPESETLEPATASFVCGSASQGPAISGGKSSFISDARSASSSKESVATDETLGPRLAAHDYFNAQRNFIRALTNLAEELRALPPESRQARLQPGIDALEIPPMIYFPLGKSEERVLRLLRFPEEESLVFNTKARCPLMMVIETQQMAYSVACALGVFSSPQPPQASSFPAADAAKASALALEGEKSADANNSRCSLDLTTKKRENWSDKSARIGSSSALSSMSGWRLSSLIVKSNDDVRQEVFIAQLLSYFARIFPADVCWLKPYHILATGPDSGLIETITSAQDLDRLKKAPGYRSLRHLFELRYGASDTPSFKAAQDNFCRSLAAYSIVMYLLLLRDRHNGNLMLDAEGHYFHIDFGFVLGHSTGKQIGGLVESAPFKLTAEYVELLDGTQSATYARFCEGCVRAMKAARANGNSICTLVEITGTRSRLPCFLQTPIAQVLPKLRKRLMMDKPESQLEAEVLRLVRSANMHKGTMYYDKAQRMQRGIAI